MEGPSGPCLGLWSRRLIGVEIGGLDWEVVLSRRVSGGGMENG